MKTTPFFKINATEYLSDSRIQSLSLEEQGAYFRLLCYAWNQEESGSLPDDDESLATLSRLGREKWEKSKAKILKNFEFVNGKWMDRRLLQESKAQKYFRENQRAKALKRWRGHPINVEQTAPSHPENSVKSAEPDLQCRGNALYKKENINNKIENKIINNSFKSFENSNLENKNPVPEKFTITPELKSWAEEKQITHIETKTECFLNYHRARANQFADWEAAWRYWMINSLTMAGGFSTKAKRTDRLTPSLSSSPHFHPSSPTSQKPTRTGKYDHLYV